MASYPTYTHAFDFYYKIAPTASGVIDSTTWYEDDYYVEDSNANVTTGWYNLSPKIGSWPTYPNTLTRNTPQTLYINEISTGVINNGALAWGSAASDFFWNVLTPSMSKADITDGESSRLGTQYSFSYNSESFLHNQFLINNPIGIGVATYPITSSWIAYEPNMIKYASGSGQGYVVLGPDELSRFPSATIVPSSVYSLPTSATPPTTTYPNAGANPTNIAYGDAATGSLDGRFFDLAGGCGITRASISASLVTFAANSASGGSTERQICTQELKKRRLFFPTIVTGSIQNTGSPGWWLEARLGRPSNEFFTENGGIYNVKFNLKRDTIHDYYPDSGQGSELKVFIADVLTVIPTPGNRTAGTSGWYPPDSNIVPIKNQPAMSFYNPATGFFMESFNINVVQYGAPAQLVFEAGGDLSTDNYFGCVIDDVTFCKVGVSTDPNLIKPQTLGGYEIYIAPVERDAS